MLGLDMENVRLKSHDKAHRRSAIILGSLRNDDADGNDDATKQ